MFFDHDLSCRVQLTSSSVVTQSLPEFQHFGLFGRRQLFNRRKPLHEAVVVIDDRCNLSLLQHDFANPDSIRRSIFPPR